MKRFICICLMLVLFVGVFSTNVGFAETANVAQNNTVDPLKARLTHMLELNYNFDKDFKDDALILENALISLNQKADDDGFIETDLVLSFINNMYGYQVDATALDQSGMPAKDGCFWVVPKGYTAYSYNITALDEYDLGVTALARVLASSHDGETYSFYIKVDFIENSDSCFGYNIASCVTVKDIGYRI